MGFFTRVVAFAAAAATVASANSLTFINQDETTRTVVFTASAGNAPIESVTIKGNDQVKVDNIPTGWIGNAYSVSEGAENVVGTLAEVAFQGWEGLTYYDVSAIVNPNDHSGVKEMFPASELEVEVKASFSGCPHFPCNKAYYLPDDIQTVTTKSTDLIVTLGNPPSSLDAREEEHKLVARHYVLGKLSA